MSTAVEKLSKLENVLLDVNVSEISGKDEFLGTAKVVLFDPNNMIPNGGPVTKKDVNVRALGESYDVAYNNALERAVSLLGL